MSTLSNVIIFAVGAAVGSLITWKIVKDKYDQLAREEIAAVKEVYFNKKDETPGWNDVDEEEESTDISDDVYKEILEKSRYTKYEEKEEDEMNKPYVIPPDEFGDEEDYDTISLIYYADKILADEFGNIIDDNEVEECIGSESLDHFGEYEDDSVFVRNDHLKCYYEILLDTRAYES